MPTMRIVIVFLQDGKQIAAYPVEIEEGDDFVGSMRVAVDRLRREHRLSIFDVTIRVDKDS